MTSFSQLFAGILLCYTTMTIAHSTPSSKFFPGSQPHLRTAIRTIERGGIGYNHGYSTLEAFFAPDPEQSTIVPFLDLRGHAFNNGYIATNVGIGLRTMSGERVYGVNAYYDYRNSQKKYYNQMGFGLETLGNFWDMRINGYLPVGKTTTAPYNQKLAGFQGHHMMLWQAYQFAMKGANAELGVHFGTSENFDFYAAAGPYYFTDHIRPHIWGGKGRVTCKFKEYVTIELSNSYDKMFHNRFQCQITLTLPFGGATPVQQRDVCNKPDTIYARMVQPVERQEIIIVGCGKKRTAVIDSTTQKPFHFVFVNNTSNSQGTYESPYPTLALAQANSTIGDIIYVFPGDGTTKGMDTGITLQQDQKFWGSSIKHTLHTTQGDFIIPAQSDSAPKMTNTAGDGITLAGRNEVSGFILTGVAGNGIISTHAQAIELSDCTIDQSELDHIHLEYNGGASGTATLKNLTLTNGDSGALFIDATIPSINCAVSNCIIQDNALTSIDFSAHKATVHFTNNTVERNVNSSSFRFDDTSALVVSGNNFNSTSSVSEAPLVIIANTSPLAATIAHNTISNNTCGALRFILNNTDSAQINISNNTISHNDTGAHGVLGSAILINPNGTTLGNCQINITDTTFSDNSTNSSALYCSNGNFNNFAVNATGNTITNNSAGGFVFDNGCNTFSLNAENNIISQGGNHGIATSGSVTLTTADIRIAHNTITENTNSANAVALSHAGTNLNLVATNNNLSANDSSGIIVYPASFIQNIAVNIAHNTINNNQNLGSNAAGGIDVEQFTNLSGIISNNSMSNNVGPDVYIGSNDTTPSACVSLSGNTSSNGYTISSGTGTFNLAPCDVATVNTGVITTIGTVTSVQSCPDGAICPP